MIKGKGEDYAESQFCNSLSDSKEEARDCSLGVTEYRHKKVGQEEPYPEVWRKERERKDVNLLKLNSAETGQGSKETVAATAKGKERARL